MIGILCAKRKKNKYSKKFYNLINMYISYKTESIIVFSVSDLDFNNKTVNGNLITQDKIKSLTTPIPRIINNFLSPRTKTSRKIIKSISEQPDIILINEANRFNQRMIMEMLLSSAKTKDFVASYSIHNSSEINNVTQKSEALIIPETGNNCITLYTISNVMKNQSCLLSKRKWIVFDIPNTLKQNGDPIIFKLHAIRDTKDKWNVLPLSKSILKNEAGSKLTQILYKSTLGIAGRIGNFIPSLSFCTVNIVLDENHSPFLVSFDGWDSSLLFKKQNSDMLDLFAEYFFAYSNLLLSSIREENYVD